MSDLISRSELLEELKSLKIVLNGKQIFSDDAKDTVLRIVKNSQLPMTLTRLLRNWKSCQSAVHGTITVIMLIGKRQ